MKKIKIAYFILVLYFPLVIVADESIMEFNGATTFFNGVVVSFSTGPFTNSLDGSVMSIFDNHPWATPINGGNDYKDITVSPATYIFNVTVSWGINVQDFKLQFFKNNILVKEIMNINEGGDITAPTNFAVNADCDLIRFLDAGNSNSGGFELSHITFDLPLPVELSTFSASVIGSKVKLNWQTTTEINNYGFEVERRTSPQSPPSKGGDDEVRGGWTKIGFVVGNNNSNSPKNYSITDESISTGRYSYRLKQIDNDGAIEFSKSVEVDLGAVKNYELTQNYPNPFNPTTTIRFTLPAAGFVKLKVYNLLGQEVITLVNETKESGVHTFSFKADELNSGVYIYKLETNGFTQIKKMTLIK